MDVVAERLQPEFAVGVEVALSEFHKAPIGPEDRKAFVDGVPRHRIQHHVDPLAVGNFANVVRESERARIDDVLRPNPAQKLALFHRPGGSENFGTNPSGILDGGQADAAGRPMNQDPLALLQSGEVVQRVIDCESGNRECRSPLEADGCWFSEQAVGGRDEMGRERVAGDAEHRVSGAKMFDAVTNRNDFARELHAQGRTGEPALERFLRQQPDALEDVPEVETRRLDVRGDLPGCGPRDRDPLQDRALLRFFLREGQSEPGFVVGLARGGLRHSPRQTRHIAPPTAQEDFVLVVAVQQLFDQRLARRCCGRLGIEIDQPARDIGPFVDNSTG